MKIIYWPIELINFIMNHFVLFYKKVQYGKNLKINGRILIRGKGRIVIGDNVTINSTYKVNPIGGNKTLLQVEAGGKLIIGNNVGISHAAITAQTEVVIEDDVLIGGNCSIYDTDFHSLKYEYRMQDPDIHVKKAPVKIGKGAFLGAHTIVLKGVVIGEKAVIGAGSVVTRDIPENEIWAGNPAKNIETRMKGNNKCSHF